MSNLPSPAHVGRYAAVELVDAPHVLSNYADRQHGELKMVLDPLVP